MGQPAALARCGAQPARIRTGLLYFSPEGLGSRRELISGALVAILFGVLPLALFDPWLVIMVLLWIHQSMSVPRHNFPPFRIGLWIGLGAVSGLFVGALFAHFVL